MDLSRNGCTRTVEQLAPALSGLPQLASLRLTGNGIGAAGGAALATLLGSLTALTSLFLGHMYIDFGDDFAEALSRLSRLAYLHLADTRIGDEAAAALAGRLSALSSLTALNLSGNDIGVVGVQSLAPALRILPRLASLDLGCNVNMGAAGTAALAVHLSTLTTLTALCLSGHAFAQNEDEDGFEEVASSIEVLPPVLRCLSRLADLSLCRYTIEASRLQRWWPRSAVSPR